MEGGDDPDCRRPMPWHKIEAGACNRELAEAKALIALRKACPQLRRGWLQWNHTDRQPRLVRYTCRIKGMPDISVSINAGRTPAEISGGKVLYSRHLSGTTLLPGGITIEEL
jgi:hypothetical protein